MARLNIDHNLDDLGQYDYTDYDMLPEPYFKGMWVDEVFAELDRLEQEAWEWNMRYMESEGWTG